MYKVEVLDSNQLIKVIEMKISSLLIVHSMLSTSKWEPIRLSDICQKVIQQSLNGYLEDSKFYLHIKDSDVLIESDLAHSLALVLSELSINSSKYATINEDKLMITVSIEQKEEFTEIIFSDNGPGFPEKILEGETMEGHIGMGIINGIVEGNMGGQVQFSNDGGACTQILFPKEMNYTEIKEKV
jgi:two-component sensor histidine kinase